MPFKAKTQPVKAKTLPVKEKTLPVTTQALPGNFNKEYEEWKIEVNTVMQSNGFGGEKLKYHRAELIKKMKTVRIEDRRAEQLNRSWDSRLVYYLPVGDRTPSHVMRTVNENAEIDGREWNDVREYLG